MSLQIEKSTEQGLLQSEAQVAINKAATQVADCFMGGGAPVNLHRLNLALNDFATTIIKITLRHHHNVGIDPWKNVHAQTTQSIHEVKSLTPAK